MESILFSCSHPSWGAAGFCSYLFNHILSDSSRSLFSSLRVLGPISQEPCWKTPRTLATSFSSLLHYSHPPPTLPDQAYECLSCLLIHWATLWLSPLPIHSCFHPFTFSTKVKIYFKISFLGWKFLRWSFYRVPANLELVNPLLQSPVPSHPCVNFHFPSIVKAPISPFRFLVLYSSNFFFSSNSHMWELEMQLSGRVLV